jgi:N-carbamoylputrescine amidase
MKIRVTICELSNHPDDFQRDWQRLAAHVRAEASALVVLPELPVAPWFATERQFDAAVWSAAVAAHERWLERLPDLAPAIVIGTRPVTLADRRLNQGFLWDRARGLHVVHTKYYLPNDSGFWEASWYDRGDGEFTPFERAGIRMGMQICTELWFMQHARAYGQDGAHLLVVPRATGGATLDKWLAGACAAAVVSGAFVLSSNRRSHADEAADLGGQGWIIGVDGDVLALTSADQPFATVELDLSEAEHAKTTYPRYVPG